MQKLFTAQTEVDVTADNIFSAKGTELSAHAYGTWDGQTISIYLSTVAAGVGGILKSDLTFTADGWTNFQVPAGTYVWATIAGAGTFSLNLNIAGQGTD